MTPWPGDVRLRRKGSSDWLLNRSSAGIHQFPGIHESDPFDDVDPLDLFLIISLRTVLGIRAVVTYAFTALRLFGTRVRIKTLFTASIIFGISFVSVLVMPKYLAFEASQGVRDVEFNKDAYITYFDSYRLNKKAEVKDDGIDGGLLFIFRHGMLVTLIIPWLFMPSSSSCILHPCRSLYLVTPLEVFNDRCGRFSTWILLNFDVLRGFSAWLFLAHSISQLPSRNFLTDRCSPTSSRMTLEMANGLKDVMHLSLSDWIIKKRDQISATGCGGFDLQGESHSGLYGIDRKPTINYASSPSEPDSNSVVVWFLCHDLFTMFYHPRSPLTSEDNKGAFNSSRFPAPNARDTRVIYSNKE